MNTPTRPPQLTPKKGLKGPLTLSAAAFWSFSRGGFPENACIGGAISERNFCEICRRKSPQNTEKHKTKLCAEVPERPLPKDPFFQLLTLLLNSSSPGSCFPELLCPLFRGPRNGAFGKPCFCPAKTRGFLTKTAKMTNLHSNQ